MQVEEGVDVERLDRGLHPIDEASRAVLECVLTRRWMSLRSERASSVLEALEREELDHRSLTVADDRHRDEAVLDIDAVVRAALTDDLENVAAVVDVVDDG